MRKLLFKRDKDALKKGYGIIWELDFDCFELVPKILTGLEQNKSGVSSISTESPVEDLTFSVQPTLERNSSTRESRKSTKSTKVSGRN